MDDQTARLIAAVRNRFTTVLGHMTGRLILQRDGYAVRQKEVIDACAEAGTIIEINANPHRLDVDWRLVHHALEKGCTLCLSPDAHGIDGLDDLRYGIGMARKGWVTADRLANTWSAKQFLDFAKKKRDR